MSKQLPVDEQITFLYTQDLSASRRFYEDVLGLPLALDQGSCRIYRMIGGSAYVGVCERETPRTPDGVIFTIVTQAVDDWYQHITSSGVECDGPPRMNETYNIYHFFFRDPNGYLFEIQRFPSTDWDVSR